MKNTYLLPVKLYANKVTKVRMYDISFFLYFFFNL